MVCRLARGIGAALIASALSAAPVGARQAGGEGQPGSAPPTPAPAASMTPAFSPLAHVEMRGEGPIPMVLIPGLGCDWRVFDDFMARNADRYTMYAVTLPGFGGSAPPPVPDSPEAGAYAQGAWLRNAEAAVAHLIAERGLEKPVVVGHSMGGHLALRLGVNHGETLRAVVAIDGAPALPMGPPGTRQSPDQRAHFVETLVAPQMAAASDQDWADQQRIQVGQMVTDPQRAEAIGEMCAAVPKGTSVRYMLELMAADITADLDRLAVPALVIAGVPPALEGSMIDPDDVRASWKSMLRGKGTVTLIFFENTRPFVTEDAPDELDEAIRALLAGERVEGKPE